MAMPGIRDEKELKLLLKKLIENPEEVFKFAVIAKGPKEGELILNKKEKLKKQDVKDAAEEELKAASKGGKDAAKNVKFDVMTGECHLLADPTTTVLKLLVAGKAPAKAVSCIDYLLTMGPFKTIGFKGVIIEEVPEELDVKAGGAASSPAKPLDTATTPPSPEALRFAQRLKTLKPNLDKVLAGGVAASASAQTLFSTASQQFKQPDYGAAHASLDQLEVVVQQGLEQLAAKLQSSGDPAALFIARLNGLKPEIKAAAGTPSGDQARLKASEAGVLAQKRDFAAANKLLDEAEVALRGTDASSTADVASVEESAVDSPYRKRRDAIEPRYLEVIGVATVDVSKLRALMAYADEQAEAGAEDKALAALDRLEPLLAEAEKAAAASPTPEEGKISPEILLTQCRLRYMQARGVVLAELDVLRKAIIDAAQRRIQDPEDRKQVTEGSVSVYELLDEHDQELIAKLDAAVNEESVEKRDALRREAATLATTYREFLDSDDFAMDVDQNGFVSIGARARLAAALDELSSRLAG